MNGKLDVTVAKMEAMASAAEDGEAYDQMIGEGNTEGNAVVQAAIDGLIDQTKRSSAPWPRSICTHQLRRLRQPR